LRYGTIIGKHDVIHKTGSIQFTAILSEEDRAMATRQRLGQKNWWSLCARRKTGRQTHHTTYTQTDTSVESGQSEAECFFIFYVSTGSQKYAPY